jgi:hypothetical protein
MSLKFLSRDEATQLINNSSYFDTFNINEIIIRTNGKAGAWRVDEGGPTDHSRPPQTAARWHGR